MLKRLLKPTAFKVALFIGVVFAAMHLVRRSGGASLYYLELLEAKAIDWKFHLRGELPLSHKVALAEIDEAAIQKYGRWPWNRALIGETIGKLDEAGAAVIALDMSFPDPDKGSGLEAVARLESHTAPAAADFDDRASAALASLPAKDKAQLEPLLQTALREHQAYADARDQLHRALADTPDKRLHDAVEKASKKLVLGMIAMDPADAASVLPELKDAWDHQVASSLVHGAFTAIPEQKRVKSAKLPDHVHWVLQTPPALMGWRPEIAGENRSFGYYSIGPDPDGTIRRYRLLMRYGDAFAPSLAVASAAKLWDSPIQPLAAPVPEGGLEGVALSDKDFNLVIAPADPFDRGQLLINWIARNESWLSARDRDGDKPRCQGASCDRVSVADVLSGTFDPAVVKGKAVFLAVTAVGTFDQRVTPFNSFGPGCFVHMNVLEDLVSGRFLTSSSVLVLAEAAMLLLIALAFGLVLPRVRLGAQMAIAPMSLGGYFGANVLAFQHGTQLTTVTPLLEMCVLTFSIVVFQYMTTDKEKRQVREAFRYYLTESVMTEMLKDPSKLKLGGEKKNLTVLFSDIRGFTTLSEMLEPSEVVRRLNEYLTPMTNLVFQTGGTLDKYMGDAIMAFWGAPVDQPDHALRACETACKMLEQLDVLRARWRQGGEADIDIGIGLNSGNIHVGNMGSDNRFDYTVIGDDVNLASRLEGTNKSYGTRVIIGENTFQQVKGRVVARELGGVVVKGKKKPVTIYELRRVGQPNPEEAEAIANFEKGLAAYRARDWDAAEAAFRAVQARWAHDGPSEKYLDDIAEKRAHPPDAGWDGVYVMKTK